MANQIVRLGPEYFPRPASGIPIAGGSIYIGKPDLDPEVPANQITVSALQENGTTVPISQPILTGGGGVPLYNGSPVTLLVSEAYSLKILDSFGSQIYYTPETIIFADAVLSIFDSISHLRGATGINNYYYVVKGHTTIGDGGGGQFLYFSGAAPATYVDDNGITIVPTGGDGSAAWIREHDGSVNVRWYGAAGDAVTDDTAAILAAISYVDSGGVVYLPSGTYKFTATLPLSKRVRLKGDSAPAIDKSDLSGTTLLKSFNGTGLDQTADGVVLEDFSLNGSVGNTGIGVWLHGSRPRCSRVHVYNQGGHGILVGDPLSSDNSNLWMLSNTRTASNGGDGIRVSSNEGGAGDANAGTLIQADSASNAGDGVYIGNSIHNVLVNVTVQNNAGRGLYLSSQAKETNIFGGDTDENNAGGNVLNEGVATKIFGLPANGLTDNGTETIYLSRLESKLTRLNLGAGSLDTNNLLGATAGFAGTESIAKLESRGNAAANRGFSIDHKLPVSGGSAVGVKFVFARTTSNESSYWSVQVKREGVALAETFRIDSSITAGETRMLVFDVTSGLMQRVKVGANATGPGGVGRALYVNNA